MTLPTANTPLYNHPLPKIEFWLASQGCQQDRENLHCWSLVRPTWKAEISLDIDQINVCYVGAGTNGHDINRAFKYSLSREDIENAIFSGP